MNESNLWASLIDLIIRKKEVNYPFVFLKLIPEYEFLIERNLKTKDRCFFLECKKDLFDENVII